MSGTLGFYARHEIFRVIAKWRPQRESSLILNLHRVSSIDSAGLVLLILMHEHFTLQYRQLTLDVVEGHIKSILELGKLDGVFSIHVAKDVLSTCSP